MGHESAGGSAGQPESATVVIFSQGKVGSVALEEALKMVPGPEVHRTHFLNDDDILRFTESQLGRVENRENREVAKQIMSAIETRWALNACKRDGQATYFISGVREPVGLIVSSIFESFEDRYPGWQESLNRDPEKFVCDLCALVRRRMDETSSVTDWFERELCRFLDIGFDEMQTDSTRGYSSFAKDGVRIFIYKQECLDGDVVAGLQQFLGCPVETPPRVNVGMRKPTALIYEIVRERLRFDEDDLAAFYQRTKTPTFYSQDEIDRFIARWSARRPGPAENPDDQVGYVLGLFDLPSLPGGTSDEAKAELVRQVERKTKFHVDLDMDISRFLANALAGNLAEADRLARRRLLSAKFSYFMLAYLRGRAREQGKFPDAEFLRVKLRLLGTELENQHTFTADTNALSEVCVVLRALDLDAVAEEMLGRFRRLALSD